MIDSVLLVRPKAEGKKEFPFGLLYAGTSLKNNGYDIKIIDLHDTPERENDIGKILSGNPNMMLGIPFLSLGYDPKNEYFCKSINYPPDMCFNIYSLTRVDPVLRVLDILFEQGNKLYDHSLPVKEAATIVKSNLTKLIELMNKKAVKNFIKKGKNYRE